jgi:hypothetical protein
MNIFPDNIESSVRKAIEAYPKDARIYALKLRSLIFAIAHSDDRVGELRETLKWSEPAFLPHSPKSGTTIRVAWKDKYPDKIGLFVPCQTSLISDFAALFPDPFIYEGNRAIWLDLNAPLENDILALFIKNALTYHLEKQT